MKENTSKISKNYISEIWAGEGISHDQGQPGHESTDYYGPDGLSTEAQAAFTFNKSLSYNSNGGFVINLEIIDEEGKFTHPKSLKLFSFSP